MAMTIGERLKKAREERNLSLEQAAFHTHIRLRYLQALENDELEALPSKVQGRGFLRLYADFLGIPVQPLLDQWAGILPPQPLEQGKQAAPPETKASEPAVQWESPTESEGEPVDTPVQAAEKQSFPVSSKIFIEIGQELKKQREALGLSLADVERYTHIRQRYLLALEAGRIDDLPSTVQGRGMLNNYAHFIELDADKLLLRLVDGLQSRRLEHVSAETSGTRRPSKRAARNAAVWQRFLTPDLLIGGTVIVFLFIFAIWGAARISAMRNAEVDATVPPLSNVLANMATQTVTAEITETPQTAVASTQIPGIEGIAETPIATGTFPVIDNAPLQVYVIARQRAWMRVITDKKIAFEGRVSPGNAYQFSGKEQIELLTGNAAALQVLFNQTDLGTLGVTGQVIGLLFTNAGVVTPTPMFTATPSPTSPPTITPLPSPTVATPTITPYIP